MAGFTDYLRMIMGWWSGTTSAAIPGRLEYTMPRTQLEYTFAAERLEFTLANERLEFTSKES